MADRLRQIDPPPSDIIEEQGDAMELKSGAVAQGFGDQDDRYYERIIYPSGKIAWYELTDEN